MKAKINSKVKGKVAELEVVNILKDRGHFARRGQQFKGTEESPDVITGDTMKEFHLEVKRVERANFSKFMEQASKDKGKDQTALVIHRKSGEKWHVYLNLEEFMDIIEERDALRGLVSLEDMNCV